jgi:hypothetical protein
MATARTQTSKAKIKSDSLSAYRVKQERLKDWRVLSVINQVSPCDFRALNRLRWDKPPREADRIETLEKLLSEEKA